VYSKVALRSDRSPKKIIRLRHSSLIDRTNRSAERLLKAGGDHSHQYDDFHA